MGMDPDVDFAVDPDVLAHVREVTHRGAQAHAQWNELFEVRKAAHPDKVVLLDRLLAKELPDGLSRPCRSSTPPRPWPPARPRAR